MKKSERTRQHIISTTAPVFNRQGFQGTSLNDLQSATGLTKGSLYGNFADKEEIAREAFRYAMHETRRFVAERLNRKKSAREKLLALLSFYAEYVFDPPIPGGCPLLNNAVEADDFHPELKEAVATEIDRTINAIAELIELGRNQGEFTRDVKPREVAIILFTSIEGAIMVSRVSGSDKSMKIVVKYCRNLLDQITV